MDFSHITRFDWDDDNLYKNIGKHDVFDPEAKQVFFNHPLVVKSDKKHSKTEDRFFALGRSNHDRLLFIVFTVRSDRIRVISARDMTKREVRVYGNYRERYFWVDHDSTDYIDWNDADIVRFPKLKPTTKSISIRLPQSLVDNLKILANKRDIPYQSLLKIFLAVRTAVKIICQQLWTISLKSLAGWKNT